MRTAPGMVSIAAFVAIPCVVAATTIHVPDQHATIQEGLDAASSGDTVLVAPGVYDGPQNRGLSFSGKSIVLVSEVGAAATTIDCESLDRGFCFDCGETPAAIVDGFTVIDGTTVNGGAVYCTSSSPTIRHCRFVGNAVTGLGGGVYCYQSSMRIEDCSFDGNTSSMGAGVACEESSPTVTGCSFVGNGATGAGGGLGMDHSCAGVISYCTFAHNDAFNGGGICCASSSPEISSCTFAGNSASNGGAVICADGSSPNLINSILAYSLDGCSLHCGTSDEPEVTRCLAFGNAAGDSLCGVFHDNLFVDPLFCNMGEDDFSLCANSPCLPGNNEWGELIGAHDQGCGDCGSSPAQGATWGSIKARHR